VFSVVIIVVAQTAKAIAVAMDAKAQFRASGAALLCAQAAAPPASPNPRRARRRPATAALAPTPANNKGSPHLSTDPSVPFAPTCTRLSSAAEAELGSPPSFTMAKKGARSEQHSRKWATQDRSGNVDVARAVWPNCWAGVLQAKKAVKAASKAATMLPRLAQPLFYCVIKSAVEFLVFRGKQGLIFLFSMENNTF
jgi:hypothetical protein